MVLSLNQKKFEILSIVLDETKRLNRLVNELLNVARMDAEGLTVNKENNLLNLYYLKCK